MILLVRCSSSHEGVFGSPAPHIVGTCKQAMMMVNAWELPAPQRPIKMRFDSDKKRRVKTAAHACV